MEGITIPTYVYKCERCKIEFDVVKRISELDHIELCEECGLPGEHVVRFNGHMAADNYPAYYNHGLGKIVRSKRDVREELSRLKGETGREVYEVGNEKLIKTKLKKTEWITEEVVAGYKKALKENK